MSKEKYHCPHCKRVIITSELVSSTEKIVSVVMPPLASVVVDEKLHDRLAAVVQELYPEPHPPKNEVLSVVYTLLILGAGLSAGQGVTKEELLQNFETQLDDFYEMLKSSAS